MFSNEEDYVYLTQLFYYDWILANAHIREFWYILNMWLFNFYMYDPDISESTDIYLIIFFHWKIIVRDLPIGLQILWHIEYYHLCNSTQTPKNDKLYMLRFDTQ